ncbi:unnamed protein product [Auanema sp. JU1783]|nr:unnamed protein product [Auanema sp. JU1783]
MADTSSKSRELEQEAEIIPAIRHDDAEWKMIQQNTFTRWVNNHLKKANSSIATLENDFSDGLKLIELAMVLSQKNLGKFNKKVMFRSQKLENVSLALNFFQDAEKIKIVNIDSSHIVDKNKKLILGLIWTLILHYSISMGLITEKREGHPEETPKQKLLSWIRSKLPGGMPLTNFTSDWNDGVALGALVNALVPSACSDWESWHPANSLKNTEQAMKSAQEKLSVEPLITSAELIHPEIDEMSVMTYLSQFPTAKPVSSPAKPLPPPIAVPSVRGEFVGLEDFPTVHTPLEFAIQISEEGYRPKVTSQDPQGIDLHHTINKKNSQLYSVKCTPTKVGDHKFQLFLVDVATAETTPVDDATVTIKVLPSPRLVPFTDRVKLGDQVKFQVKDALMGLVDIVIVDPANSEIHLPVLEEQSGFHSADYIPSIKGLHTVNAFYRKSRIEGSPFALHVHEKIPEFNIWGRGLKDDGVRVGDEVPIYLTPIGSESSTDDDVEISVTDPAGLAVPITEPSRHTPTRVFTYTPSSSGKHKVEVKSKDSALGKSPYFVDVLPETNSAVRAYGPGLRGGVANMPSVFEVLTNGHADSLSFSIEGPSKTTIQCLDKSDGVASVAYTPTEPGIYSVNVLAGGEHIQDSPFVLNVDPYDNSFQPGAVRITGLDSNTIHRTHEPVIFQIDSRRSGVPDPVELVVFNNNMESIPVKITEKTPGMYDAEFIPDQPAKYHVDASLRGVAVPGAPFSITAKEPVDISKLRMYGPGIEGPVYSQEPTHFTIDAKQAGTGVVEVSLDDRAGRAVDIDVLDNSDGSFTVKYTAPRPGAYQLNVVFAGEKIPPIQINVKPHVDTSGIHVDFLENAIVTVNCEKEFHVFTADGDNTRIIITSPSGEVVEAIIESTESGVRVRFTPSEIGDYKIDVTYQDLPVPGFTPVYMHSVAPGPSGMPTGARSQIAEAEYVVSRTGPARPDLVVVSGPGLGPVVAQYSTSVTIDTSSAGFGDIDLFVDGPTRTPVHCVDNQDGTLTMHYVPKVPGLYWLRVMFDDEHIPGSPFQIMAVAPLIPSPSLLQAEREATESSFSGSVLIGHRWNISVDTGVQKQKTQGLEVVAVIKDKEYLIPMKTNETKYTGTFVATEAGEVKFKVLFDNLLVKEYVVNVAPGCDASKCKATGLGLTEGVVNAPSTFQINTQSAGVGDLAVDIAGPSDTESRIVDHEDRTCTVEFIPREPGTYTVDVMYGDKREKIPGSPFNCNVDYPIAPSTVQVCGLDQPLRNRQPFDFIIDASKTKIGPITCRVPPVYQQPLVLPTSKSKRIHKVRFTPVGDPGEEIPLEVFYCDEPVGNSPYLLKLLPEVDVHNLTLKNDLGGVLKNVRAKKNARLMLDGSNCGYVKTLQADVLGPDGCSRECTIEPHENKGLFIITFPVDMAGKYKIASSINGISSPPQFVSIVPVSEPGDAVLKKPLNLQDCHIPLNVPSSLTFELKDDPDLNLAIIPTVKDAVDIKRISQKLPSGKVLEEVILTPLAPGVNSIAFFFGGIKVHQIDYNAVAQSQLDPKESVDKFERDYTVAPNSKPFQQLDFKFDIPASPSGSDKLEAFVTMPSGSRDVAQIIDNHDGSVLVKYQPKTHGQHELSIVQNGAAVNGSPLKFFVDAYGDGLATVYGPGLSNAVVGEPAHFTVCAKGSNAKELSVSIEGPAQSTIKIHDNKDGTCSVNWTPPVPGEYKVHVKLGKHEVKESPFRVLVAGSGQKRAHLSVGSTSEVALTIANSTEIKGISASIKSPSGIDEPCLCRLIDGGKLGVSFTPREAGEHLITVKRDGKLVSKAPFKVKVDKSQVGDASKVEVTGKGKAAAVCMQDNEIIVDTTKAGYGGLSVSVQGPSKAELTCKEVKAGLIKVMYKPTEPGVYAIAVKFADHHVKDSPLTVNCTGKGAGTIQSVLKKKTEQAAMCLPNQEAVLYMKLASCSPMDTTARVMDPKGKTEDVEMRDTGDNYYLIKFRPAMEGVHNLSILHRDTHVNGSPFQFTVGSFKEGGAHKVRASGLGVVRGETNNKQYFNVYTREAGAGDLSVTIEGPSKPTFEFKDHKDGNCHVEYQVAAPGEYNVSVKFNDIHIPDSPFKVFIAAATGEARKLELASFHDQIPTGKAFTFTVLTHRARGHLEAKVTTPGHLTETIDIVPIEEGESYALRFIPKESGNHYIHVTLDGAPMRDSPFRIRVGGADLSDPTAIHAEGEGLLGGETGHKCEFVIKTVNAGSGVLTCQIDGPSKVTLDAYETTQGYKVRYTPLAPGDYFAAVKYNGVHIPGSPFKIVIDGKVLGGNGYNESSEVKVDARAKTSQGNVATVPEYKGDASKVVAKGAGLNKFFPGRPSVFTIDTGLAGTNLLMVGVVTTKGPCDEVIVKHQGNGHYAVNYRIPDRVKGFVFIKYGDQEIPGSPFSITP